MNTWIAVGLLSTFGITLCTLWALFWVRLSGYRASPGRDSGLDSEFSLTRLSPMARLLGDEDLDFLRQFEQCRPRIVDRWDRDRRRIFRLYLREAASDFRRMHARARTLVAHAPEQQADLVGLLMRQQLTFWRALIGIELRLTFSGLGFGKVDGSRIANLLEAMQLEVNRSIAPASA